MSNAIKRSLIEDLILRRDTLESLKVEWSRIWNDAYEARISTRASRAWFTTYVRVIRDLDRQILRINSTIVEEEQRPTWEDYERSMKGFRHPEAG